MGTSPVLVGHCQKCHAPIGQLTKEELDYVVFESGQKLLCFDCEPDVANRLPEFYRGLHAGLLLTIGDVVQCVGSDDESLIEVGFSHAHERARARGLSSVTYLNRIYKEMTVEEDWLDYEICVTCHGAGQIIDYDWSKDCPICGGSGKYPIAIFLPLWLVSGGRENA